MALPTKTTLLFVHGGWHAPESYFKLTIALRATGSEIHVPRHLAMNQSRPPNADLASRHNLIRSYATSLVDSRQIVAVLMHSYSGQVGTNSLYGLSREARAAKGQRGGISRLMYMTAFALPEGKSVIDKVAELDHMDRIPVAFAFDDDQSCVPNYPKESLIGEPYKYCSRPKQINPCTHLAPY